MLTAKVAKELVERHLGAANLNWVVTDAPHYEGQTCWVFSYQSKAYIESGNITDALAGNAPLLVERSNGNVIVLGTAQRIEFYVENYEKFGDPFKS